MRAEKHTITKEYFEKLKDSPFFLVADYHGLTVSEFSNLRTQLRESEAEIHVIKNNLFRLAAKDAGFEIEADECKGQQAVVTGKKDIAATAKVLKSFQSTSEKPRMKFGFLDEKRYTTQELRTLADLPPMDVLRGQLLATINEPATRLVRLLNTPGEKITRAIKAKSEKE
ncbi:MAG: 50S ribosomal protein L10 [Verrucomicrobia bacterium]|nr:50S ribosomal protein L10 [Verrucomicrobiota bacterium]